MKTYVSYVIQDDNGHKHQSEIVTTQSPPYSYSPDPLVEDVIKWAENKKRT